VDDKEESEEGIRTGDGLGDGSTLASDDLDDPGDPCGDPSGDGGKGMRGDSSSVFRRVDLDRVVNG
jgi:hypothetical protein